jgi:predicted transcriptional regulator
MCVEQIMARPVHSCRPDDSLADAEQVMREARRRLPVVDESDVPVGVISPADKSQAAAERASTAGRPEITPLEVGMAFAEISCPLHRQLRG